MHADAPLLEIEKLSVAFPSGRDMATAVRDLNLVVPAGAVTCLVGESGCGKSLTARAILRLTPPTAALSGRVLLKGEDLLALSEAALRRIRGRRIGMIFQEPMTSLNPVLTVGEQTAEPLRLHLGMGRKEARNEVERLFSTVGIPAARNRYDDYPHQLSGGMRQRVMIAMALACAPELLLADEPTTALDTTIQRQILQLITDQSRACRMATLLITHDLNMVRRVADMAGVMYAGCLVEYAPTQDLFAHPVHPYTRALMACAPVGRNASLSRLPAIPGTVPALRDMPKGCPFAPRCGEASPRCSTAMPPSVAAAGHSVTCWRAA